MTACPKYHLVICDDPEHYDCWKEFLAAAPKGLRVRISPLPSYRELVDFSGAVILLGRTFDSSSPGVSGATVMQKALLRGAHNQIIGISEDEGRNWIGFNRYLAGYLNPWDLTPEEFWAKLGSLLDSL